MNEERFERAMRDAVESYNRPPDVPPLEEMWEAIERTRAGAHEAAEVTRPFPMEEPRRRIVILQPWLRTAAVLVLGLAMGRASVSMFGPVTEKGTRTAQTAAATGEVPSQYQSLTDHYFGQAAALLIALPGELNSKGSDTAFLSRADDLLLQTRMLLDSPAASDPGLRTLFEDLEVVLIQVVRLQADRDQTKIDLLNQSMQQRDVIPRLRNAVVDHISD